MEIVLSLYDFFNISAISQSATLIDVVNSILEIGLSVWITLFITRCLFLATTLSNRRFF